MNHPLVIIPANRRLSLFVLFFLLTMIVMVVLNLTGESLKTDTAPAGIVSYEFAGDVTSAQSILNTWDGTAKINAGFNLGLDYLFLTLYSTTIAMGIVWVTMNWVRHRQTLVILTGLAWGQWLAAGLDAIENSALMIMLMSAASEPWPFLARWCALLKFALVIIGIIYVVAAALSRFVGSRA